MDDYSNKKSDEYRLLFETKDILENISIELKVANMLKLLKGYSELLTDDEVRYLKSEINKYIKDKKYASSREEENYSYGLR